MRLGVTRNKGCAWDGVAGTRVACVSRESLGDRPLFFGSEESAMNKPNTIWGRYCVVLCLSSGFLAGMFWWISLMMAFGHTDMVVYAPLAALPWTIAGTIVGGVSTLVRGYWVPVMAALGTIAGGVYSLWANPFDGWLAITMPVDCFLGTFVGVLIGAISPAIPNSVASSPKGTLTK